ncbi:hypothetical protein JCM10207_005869 [Rhodosporidiobolus poonsookiae]
MDELRKIPPFTRVTVLGVLATTLPVILQLVSPYSVAFIPHKIASDWQLQRLVLPFLFGGGGINLVFSLIMLYRSLVDLEQSHFGGRLADMTWAFILICAGIIGLNTPLSTPFLFNPLLMAVTHLWAQNNPTNQVSLYGIITIPAVFFPFAMLGMDLLNGGPGAVLVSFTGMVAAHLYYFLSVVLPRQSGGRPPALVASLLSPPQFLVNTLGNGAGAPSSFASGASGSTPGGAAGRSYSTGFGTAWRAVTGGGGGGGRTLGGAPGSRAGSVGGQAPTAPAGGSGTGSSAVRQAEHRWVGRGQRLGSE